MLTIEPNDMDTNVTDTIAVDTPPVSVCEKNNEPPAYGKAEGLVSALVFLLAVLFVRFVIFNVTGIISSLIYIAIITLAIIYMKKKEFAFSGFNKALAAVLYMFSTVFTITDNCFIKFLNGVFLFCAGAYFIYSVCAKKEGIERYLPYALKKSVLEYPFSEFRTQISILTSSAKNSDTSSNIKRIIAGLFLTVPVTIIVGSLLMSADDGMNRILTGIFEGMFTDEMCLLLIQVCIALPCSCYLFGMFYSNVFRRRISDLSEAECDGKLRSKRTISNLVFYSAVTPVLILYVMFFISQASYFLSAFMGMLPEEFSYAEYARKGFFELCWIVVINLGIMIIMNLHSKYSGEEKTTTLKVFNIIFCIFTLILIATAMSKMVMYIDAYGLTTLRVYTTWFMVLCTFVFLLILVKQFRPQMDMAKLITAGFTLMFALLCFSRSEALIVRYNHAMNKVTAENFNDSGITSMSDDGLLAAVNEGLLSEEEARGLSSCSHYKYKTDSLNLSTMILEYKLSESNRNE